MFGSKSLPTAVVLCHLDQIKPVCCSSLLFLVSCLSHPINQPVYMQFYVNTFAVKRVHITSTIWFRHIVPSTVHVLYYLMASFATCLAIPGLSLLVSWLQINYWPVTDLPAGWLSANLTSALLCLPAMFQLEQQCLSTQPKQLIISKLLNCTSFQLSLNNYWVSSTVLIFYILRCWN